MKRKIVMLIGVILICSQVDRPQSRAYAKFDSHGRTIGLFNLLRGRPNCRSWQVFGGTIERSSAKVRNSELNYRFTILVGRQRRHIGFVLKEDELSPSVISDLVTRDGRVKARACESAGRWIAEEITRE